MLMQIPQYRPRPWAEPILTLMKAFNIKFKYLAYAGEADIHFVASIFKQFNLPFWEHLMLEYKQIHRKVDMNGNLDTIREKHFDDSGGIWMNTRVIG